MSSTSLECIALQGFQRENKILIQQLLTVKQTHTVALKPSQVFTEPQ